MRRASVYLVAAIALGACRKVEQAAEPTGNGTPEGVDASPAPVGERVDPPKEPSAADRSRSRV